MLRTARGIHSPLTDGGEVVSLTSRPRSTPEKYFWSSYLLEAESNVGPQCGWKNDVKLKYSMTSSSLEHATFWLVAQCLNKLREVGYSKGPNKVGVSISSSEDRSRSNFLNVVF
jgi:hypothetical protein